MNWVVFAHIEPNGTATVLVSHFVVGVANAAKRSPAQYQIYSYHETEGQAQLAAQGWVPETRPATKSTVKVRRAKVKFSSGLP